MKFIYGTQIDRENQNKSHMRGLVLWLWQDLPNVMLIGATNHPEMLEATLLRLISNRVYTKPPNSSKRGKNSQIGAEDVAYAKAL